VIPAGARPSMGKLVDLEMLVCTGGRERTVAEFRELLARGGFRLKKIFSGAAPLSIIEAVPRPGPA
ncbi:MAG: hypothetical protein GIW99_00645, partial [Candidatus Eremiobacteraeota bacterium]|nr:hypothetical protein [Candidatus Eremiobacteraeota bacterium]